MIQRITFLFLVILVGSTQIKADNWGHWRGQNGNGVADANPPVEWNESTNIKWKVPIPGKGSGTPIIWDDRVYVVTAVSTGQAETRREETPQTRPESDRRRGGRRRGRRGAEPLTEMEFKLLCFQRATGKLDWEKTAIKTKPHQNTHNTNGFASASPCTDGDHVYAHFGSRGLYCYTMDGELKWKRDDLGKMTTRNNFGEGSSPTLAGEKIIVPWDHEGQSRLYALNKLTGETIWKIERDEPTCWATPLVVEHDGRKQIIMNGENYARSYDLDSGDEIWRCAGQTARPVASAVTHDGIVFVGSGYRGAFLGAFRLDGKGDIEDTEQVVWSVDRDTPDVASPVLSNGRIYFYKARNGILSCHDALTGKPHYTASRIDGLRSIYASPVAAGGHIYLTGRSGTTVVIKDSSQLEIVSTNSVGETVDATPAPVDNELFIRGEQHLFCIAH